MNLKDTINFKTLREKGPAAIDVKGDEVVQVISKGSEVKVIISQEHYLNLPSAYTQLLIRSGKKNEEAINLEDRLKSFEERLAKMLNVSGETEKKDKKWQDGRKMDGRN